MPTDLSFWSDILKTYGIGAIFGFFFMQIFKGVLKHYMKTIDAKDRHIKEIIDTHQQSQKALIDSRDAVIREVSQSNLSALSSNTAAIHKLTESHLEVAHTMKNVCDGIERTASQSAREHGEILGFFRVAK